VTPSRYDDELWELVPEEPGPPPEPLRRFVHSLGHAERALDLGCGDGRLSGELDATELPAARIVELEPDAPLPFDDASFDLVLCAETIEHVRDVQLFLSEIRRVLRPGGTLALSTPAHLPLARLPDPLSPHLRLLSRHSLRRLLDQLGFDVASLQRRSGTLFALATR
jgi:SAM-dependent methyltransferase